MLADRLDIARARRIRRRLDVGMTLWILSTLVGIAVCLKRLG